MMADPLTIAALGYALHKPVKMLLDKISEVAGIVYEPTRIKRIARATAEGEVEAEKIKALGRVTIEASKELSKRNIDQALIQRTLTRFVREETIKQENMEDIIELTLPNINDDAKPENIENDWLLKFFDHCKFISNEEMQKIWAGILAGEANKPGSFSKRTLNTVSLLSKGEAEDFKNLVRFNCKIKLIKEPPENDTEYSTPLIMSTSNKLFENNGVYFGTLLCLELLGLLSLAEPGIRSMKNNANAINIFYNNNLLELNMKRYESQYPIGMVLLTSEGQEIASIINARPVEGYFEYLKEFYNAPLIPV